MASSMRVMTIALMVGSMLIGATAYGQIVYGQPTTAGTRIQMSHWQLKNDSITVKIDQYSAPLAAFVPLGQDFEAQLYVAGASNKLTSFGTDYKLTGLGDTRIQLSHSFSQDHLLVSGGVSLPTGKKKLNFDEEYQVLQELTKNFLTFPVRRYGEGFGFNGMIGGATMLGSVRAGAGVMYQYIGKYTPYEGADKYDPGDLISVNGGLDGGQGSWLWSGNLIFTVYAVDKYNGAKTFKQGAQTELQFSVRNEQANNYSLGCALSYLLRGRNTRYTTADSTGTKIIDQLKLLGNEFSADVNFTRMLGTNWFAGPEIQVRLVGADERPADARLESSNILGFGGMFGRKLGKGTFDIGGSYFTGSADGGDQDVTGYQVYLDLKLAL
jgi:hypothetical protein